MMKNLFSVAGKVAVVTGGSRGIGAMIARGFVENGVKTYITARKEAELQACADALSALGGEGNGECIAMVSDLSSLEGIKSFTETLKEKEKKIDILLNNAGATWGENFDSFSENGWDKVMDLNVKAPFFLIQQLLPLLRASGGREDPARIVNISSINAMAYSGMNNYSYSASKAALVQMTRHLAADLVDDDINVNGIAPGFFPSKMMAFILDGHEDEMAASIPRGRIGETEDIAGTTIYLCSRASAWMTGHTLVLDGGMLANAG